mmetsp:Transcript_4788/g.11675  ORF Transcript_4788/g.11675 Transcript_4788/m.11675 type:complete len:606 (+) Transcript_4788:206-2023(+)
MSTTTEEATMGGADAFKIGIAFVKQYYKTLSSHPELLENFYSPTADAYLSHAEGSEPTQPVPPAGTDHKVVWGCGAGETMLFEFEDGAIDAQPSANKGILLVVTAVVIFTVRETGEARRRKFVQTFFLAKIGRNFAVLNDILRFLVATPEITIAATATATATATSLAAAAAASTEETISTSTSTGELVEESSSVGASVEQPVDAAAAATAAVATKEEEPSKPKISQPPAIVEEKKVEVVEEKAVEGSVSESTDEASAPGGGVEETKEEAPEEEEASAQTNGAAAGSAGKKRSSSKEGKGKKNKGGKQQQQQQQQQQQKQQPAPTASKPTPGSWASLVVSGSAPNTPSRTAVQEKRTAANNTSKTASKTPPLPPSDKKDAAKSKENGESTGAADDKVQDKDKDKTNTTTTTTTTNNNNNNTKSNAPGAANKDKAKLKENTARDQRTKRDPDNTLVIKNLSDNVKEQDIINMFQPFATMTKAKIVGTNVNHHRNLAFVDYDSVAPVLAALKKHKETPFEWNGKVLEVDQKTLEQRARRKAGGNNNPNNHNANGYRPTEGKAGRGQNGYRPGGPNPGRGGGGSGGGGDDKFNKGGNAGGRRRGTRAGR